MVAYRAESVSPALSMHRSHGRVSNRCWDSRTDQLPRSSSSDVPIIACFGVRVLPAPPRTPAQFRFPGAFGIVFPRLCRRGREIERSLSPRNGHGGKKASPVSGSTELFPGGIPAREQRLVRMSTETGSSCNRWLHRSRRAMAPGSLGASAIAVLYPTARPDRHGC
jgi:hypothetical protein